MDTEVLVAILAVLLGAGGTGGIGLFITMLNNYKKGKIEDDGTMIDRLNAEAKVLIAARKTAEAERDGEHQGKLQWMNQSFRYRMQLASASPPITPNDIPELWDWHSGKGPGPTANM